MKRNLTAGEGITDDKVGVPMGYTDKGWIMPQKGGMISARTEGIGIDTTATGVRGMPGEGTAAFGIDTNTPAGELVVTVQAGGAPASIGISTNTPALTASINGTGTAAIGIDTNTPTLGAEASLIGSAAIGVTGDSSTIWPLDDSPVLREASATFGFDGALTRYAVGHMEGTTEESGLTPDGIANAVWSKLIEAGFTAEEIIRLLAAHAAGSATGLEGSNPQFTGLDGATVRIDGTYAGGNRTIDALNGA
jgi:hypothetical protein